jgi:hypothetical protein
MKKRIIALASISTLIISLTMCTEQRVSKEYFGRFTLTTNLTVDKLKWEGGNSRLNYAELCRDDGQLCFRGDDDLDYSYSRKMHRLAVDSSKKIKIYNTESGAEIPCDFSSQLKYALGRYWSESSLIIFSRPELNNFSHKQADTFFVGSGSCRKINSISNAYPRATSGIFQDVESRHLAWFECKENSCTLAWLDADFLTLHSKEIGCKESDELVIYWINGVPEPRGYEWPKDKICLNENGEPKYPFVDPFIPNNAHWPDYASDK